MNSDSGMCCCTTILNCIYIFPQVYFFSYTVTAINEGLASLQRNIFKVQVTQIFEPHFYCYIVRLDQKIYAGKIFICELILWLES